jgi:riboflavin biosynthesis pyrimidine reductase
MRAGLIDEYAIVTHPVLVGGGTPSRPWTTG